MSVTTARGEFMPCLSFWEWSGSHNSNSEHATVNLAHIFQTERLVGSAPFLATPLWCKQTVKPQGLGLPPQHLLRNWFSLRPAGAVGDGFFFPATPHTHTTTLPSLHTLHIRPQPWKTRTEPGSNEPWETYGDRGGGGVLGMDVKGGHAWLQAEIMALHVCINIWSTLQ